MMNSLNNGDENRHVTSVWGKKCNYLAMNLDYSENGKFKVDITCFVKNMIEEFGHKVKA